MSEVKQDIFVCIISVLLVCTAFFIMCTIKRTDYYTSMPIVELETGDNIDAYIYKATIDATTVFATNPYDSKTYRVTVNSTYAEKPFIKRMFQWQMTETDRHVVTAICIGESTTQDIGD